MINMDMIGRSKEVPADWLGLFGKKDRLVVYGTGTADCFADLVDCAGQKCEFKLSTLKAGTGPSDHDSFYRKRIPVLFLYTGTHNEYHKPTDVPEKINVPAMKKATDFAELVASDLLTRVAPPKYAAVSDPWNDPTDPRPRGPQGPRLGFAPGNYESPDGGVLVESVSPGGPAEKAGIKNGDIIVEIAGKPVKNIVGYMSAMSGQKLGTTIDVVVQRKGKKMTLKAELK
jgi:membrane-associated protease RseP (regulator of RpoE activity)